MPRIVFPAWLAVVVALSVTSAGCGGSSSSPQPAVAEPPNNLGYSTNPATYVVGQAISPSVPTSGGGAVANYSVAPSLPPGLSLDTVTGTIAGTPTLESETSTYVVTAANARGSTTCMLEIRVTAPAPRTLSYATNPAVYSWDAAIPANIPHSVGGTASSFSVSPALPEGLALDASTGVITGTPAATGSGVYTVMASNSGGDATVDLSIAVVPLAWKSLSVGIWSTCGVGSNDIAYCWGGGRYLPGDASSLGPLTKPNRVVAPPQFDQLAASDHVCGLAAGALYCWGENDVGQAVGGTVVQPSPTPVSSQVRFAKVAPGRTQSCALTVGGAISCWGSSYGAPGPAGNLLAGAYVDVATSQDVACGLDSGGGLHCWGANATFVGSFSAVPLRSISLGVWMACGIGTDDRVHCWGDSTKCEVGTAAVGGKVTLPGDVAAASVSTGCFSSCALDVNGAVYCWGRNLYGALGLGAGVTGTVSTPTAVPGLPAMSTIGVSSGDWACGLSVEGRRWCWGTNFYGQLGNGTSGDPVFAPIETPY